MGAKLIVIILRWSPARFVVNNHDVNLESLSKKLDALEEILRGLRAEVEAAKDRRDPFAVHVFLARAEYDRAVVNDKSKSGRGIENAVHNTYRKACDLGYQGSLNEWRNILWLGRPAAVKTRFQAYS